MPGHKIDANQQAIKDASHDLGFGWLDMTQQRPSVGFDGFLLVRGMMLPCEVKNPGKAWTLTKKEKDTAAILGMYGVAIHTLEYPEDVIRIVEMESEE